jgi:hypothetical protein
MKAERRQERKDEPEGTTPAVDGDDPTIDWSAAVKQGENPDDPK